MFQIKSVASGANGRLACAQIIDGGRETGADIEHQQGGEGKYCISQKQNLLVCVLVTAKLCSLFEWLAMHRVIGTTGIMLQLLKNRCCANQFILKIPCKYDKTVTGLPGLG